MKTIALHIKNLSMLKKKKEIYRNCFMCMWGFDFTMPSDKGSYAFCQALGGSKYEYEYEYYISLDCCIVCYTNQPWKKEKIYVPHIAYTYY